MVPPTVLTAMSDMRGPRNIGLRPFLAAAVLGWLLVRPLAALAVPQLISPLTLPPVVTRMTAVLLDYGPSITKSMHHMATRTEHVLGRLETVLGFAALLWLWVVLSVAAFLIVAAVASATDLRMLTLRHDSPGALSIYLARGIRLFFRVLRDRRTPNPARMVLVAALLYWLLPMDVIPDRSYFPGFVDDFIVAAVAAKLFIYLCPDWLLVRHAFVVQARRRRA